LIDRVNRYQAMADKENDGGWNTSAQEAQYYYAHRNWSLARLYDMGYALPNPYVTPAEEVRAAIARVTEELRGAE